MINDPFTSTIDFAIGETTKRYENAENENDRLLYRLLKSSQEVWKSIRIHGLELSGMTYEQFCEQCKEKKNIIFLSDDEVRDFNKAIKIMQIFNDEV